MASSPSKLTTSSIFIILLSVTQCVPRFSCPLSVFALKSIEVVQAGSGAGISYACGPDPELPEGQGCHFNDLISCFYWGDIISLSIIFSLPSPDLICECSICHVTFLSYFPPYYLSSVKAA